METPPPPGFGPRGFNYHSTSYRKPTYHVVNGQHTPIAPRKTMKIIHDAPGRDTYHTPTPFHGLFGDICNNCGKPGHTFKQCKNPITSFGVIVFRRNPEGRREYLMIRRKDTLGYIDFMRGKYSIPDSNGGPTPNGRVPTESAAIKYVLNMFKQMTREEKIRLLTLSFDELWGQLWGSASDDQTPAESYHETFRQEEIQSREKFMFLNMQRIQQQQDGLDQTATEDISRCLLSLNDMTVLQYLVVESERDQESQWDEPEWGFPKGRRNYQERDYECALREMCEETGYSIESVVNIKNILPFEEYFIGSNYKSYKHKYYLMYMDYEVSLGSRPNDKTEVSSMSWKTYEECLKCIRPYNGEKKRLITNIENALSVFIAAG
jgi:8-oxo-dGTP pyrophosphatase MutT (NUDIX family)